VVFGTWYINKIINHHQGRLPTGKDSSEYTKGFIFCAALIYAGALGNLIDSCFYGLIFDKGMVFDPSVKGYVSYSGLAKFSSDGYAGFLHGNVVDMLYFPLIRGHFPTWFPLWGGDDFEFFRPIFNIADASISTGVITILVFQKRFFKQRNKQAEYHTVETRARVDDASQVS
jgi:signal peptidase II